MKDLKKWALLVSLILSVGLFVSCIGCGGGRLDLSETNTLELVPDENSTYSRLVITMYGDGSTHVEGQYMFSGNSFSDDTDWKLIEGTYHDTKVKGIDINIPGGYDKRTLRKMYHTITITPNLDCYEGGFDDVKGGYQRLQGFKPKGHFIIK